MAARTKKFTMLLSEDESRILSELAAAQEPPLSNAMYLRWLIRQKYKALKVK